MTVLVKCRWGKWAAPPWSRCVTVMHEDEKCHVVGDTIQHLPLQADQGECAMSQE